MNTTTADPLRLEDQVCFALAIASRSVVALYRPILAPLGLTHPQYLVMLALWQHRTLSLARLGAVLALDPATVSPLVKRLEGQGLLSRRRRTNDERVLDIGLTPAGERLRERALAVPGAVVARLGMPVSELERLRDTLSAFIDTTGSAHV